MNRPRPKILFLQTSLYPRGGANAVAAWIVQALKDDHEVTVLTADPVNWQTLNQFYGTSIQPNEVAVIKLKAPIRAFFRLDPDPDSIQPLAYMMRICRRIRHRYDLVISAAMDEADLGGEGLLYIHYPGLGQFWKSNRDCEEDHALRRILSLLRGRIRPWVFLSGYSLKRLKQCRILTNSDWTGAVVRNLYGVPTQTIYPPATAAPCTLPWKARQNSFVTIGRFNQFKRLEWIVELFHRLRQVHPNLSLHIVGTPETGKEASRSYRWLVEQARTNPDWLTIHEELPRHEMLGLLGRVKYAVHAKIDEHFGIAPAEALLAGCIPFVHNSGGQVEIVGRDPRLCFSEAEDATAKIDRVLSDALLQDVLRASLQKLAPLFTAERFKADFRRVIESALG